MEHGSAPLPAHVPSRPHGACSRLGQRNRAQLSPSRQELVARRAPHLPQEGALRRRPQQVDGEPARQLRLLNQGDKPGDLGQAPLRLPAGLRRRKPRSGRISRRADRRPFPLGNRELRGLPRPEARASLREGQRDPICPLQRKRPG